MKTATIQIYRAITVTVMLVVFLGTVSTVTAGDTRRFVRPRHTTETQNTIKDTGSNTPRPVADEKPINPELLKNSADDNSTPASDSNRPPVKRASGHHR